MTLGSVTTESAPRGPVPDDFAADCHTLAGEHALLMRDLVRRAAPLLARLDAEAWPEAELGALINFLHSAVLRQVSDEEALLFPPDSSGPPVAELSADHVRLHVLTAQLEAAHEMPSARARLRALVEELLTTLRRHLAEEEAVLAALADAADDVPSAADVVAGKHAWLSADDAPVVILLDTLPDAQVIELCIERLLRLRPGQTAELHAADDQRLRRVCRWMHDFDAACYGLSLARDGQEHVLRVTCRRADTSAGVGYPG